MPFNKNKQTYKKMNIEIQQIKQNIKEVEKQQIILQQQSSDMLQLLNQMKSVTEYNLIGLDEFSWNTQLLLEDLNKKFINISEDILFFKIKKLPQIDSHVLRIYRHMVAQEKDRRNEVDI